MRLQDTIREVPDFPKKGILFYDITTLAKNPQAFHQAIDQLAEHYRDHQVDVVVSVEARGFIFGAALAYKLGAGFVPVRKPGKLPAEKVRVEYALEYGTDAMEIHKDAIAPGQRVLVFDDVLATGGTIAAAIDLVKRLGGAVIGTAFLIDLTFLNGKQKIGNYEVFSLIQY
ncbi:MAG: adenine phosphoribosyltransferase [Chloroflexi bacterium]|nr:adenine phosphoribosyltransferase [Chloroflexota bacterium]